jgi:iron complex transport system substrate-binding protein
MKIRIFSLLLALLCLLSALPFALAEGEIALTDMSGAEVTLAGPAEKIVAMTPADVEILYALGAGDKLVARGAYCNYPPEALALPDVETGAETNVEQILALNPDVIIMSVMAQRAEQVEALRGAGVAVVVTDGQTIDGVYQQIELVGKVVGKAAEAEALIARMQEDFADIEAEAGEGSGKSVYFEVSPLQYGLWTAGAGTFMDELAALAGLTNAFADVTGWAEISEEQVLARNPDYIVTLTMYFGEGPTPEEEILARDGWQSIKAVQNGAVLVTDADAISRPGPRLVQALRDLYAFTSK